MYAYVVYAIEYEGVCVLRVCTYVLDWIGLESHLTWEAFSLDGYFSRHPQIHKSIRQLTQTRRLCLVVAKKSLIVE